MHQVGEEKEENVDTEDAEDTVPGRKVRTGKNGPGVQNGC